MAPDGSYSPGLPPDAPQEARDIALAAAMAHEMIHCYDGNRTGFDKKAAHVATYNAQIAMTATLTAAQVGHPDFAKIEAAINKYIDFLKSQRDLMAAC